MSKPQLKPSPPILNFTLEYSVFDCFAAGNGSCVYLLLWFFFICIQVFLLPQILCLQKIPNVKKTTIDAE